MQRLDINGKIPQVEVDPEMSLLWVLRDVLDMTGTKFRCGTAAAGRPRARHRDSRIFRQRCRRGS
jgi:aerobic-type carbon monoxide dehydrogenase small subunit (CoxS/CutS family)